MAGILNIRDFLLGIGGAAAGFVAGALWKRRDAYAAISDSESDSDDDDSSINDEDDSALTAEPHKLVLCVRTDLKMQKGKIAAQVGHATLGAYKAARRRNPQALQTWEGQAQPKIAVQISSTNQATQLQNAAKRFNLTTYVVYDAGRTQVAAVCFLSSVDAASIQC